MAALAEALVVESITKKSNHQANIVRITEVLPHGNADKLEIIQLGGYQVVVRKGDFKPGTLGVYIQPDSVIPQTAPFSFIWQPYVDSLKNDPTSLINWTDVQVIVPEKRRRITVRKFRGEWSEGLLLPVTDFGFATEGENAPRVGEDVSDLLGITHYDPDKGVENTKGESMHAPRYKRPKTLKGWVRFILRKLGILKTDRAMEVSFEAPVYDVEAYKNHKNTIDENEFVYITEKIHGSNARYVYLDGEMYAGSRNLWKAPNSNCVWRKALKEQPWIELICKANPGYIVYGEVTPTQKGFNYGNEDGSVRFFLFDIRTPDGRWLPRMEYVTLKGIESVDLGYAEVPHIFTGAFNAETVKQYVDGQSLVENSGHIREGVVIRPVNERSVRGLGRVQLKAVSNAFLEKDSK